MVNFLLLHYIQAPPRVLINARSSDTRLLGQPRASQSPLDMPHSALTLSLASRLKCFQKNSWLSYFWFSVWHLMIFIIHKVFNNNKLIFNFFFKASIYYYSKERGRAAKSLGLKWTLGAELSGLPYYPAPPIPNNVLQKSSAQNGLSQEKTCLS